MGKSAGLCGHVTCSGTRLFQEEDRKAQEAARLCCNTPQQTTTGPVDTAAAFFFPLGQSLWGTVSSTVLMAAWVAPPTLPENYPDHGSCPSPHLEACVLAFSLNITALQNSEMTWAMAADTWIWDKESFPNAWSSSLQGLLPTLVSWVCDLCT